MTNQNTAWCVLLHAHFFLCTQRPGGAAFVHERESLT
jgi:hypothetical protein